MARFLHNDLLEHVQAIPAFEIIMATKGNAKRLPVWAQIALMDGVFGGSRSDAYYSTIERKDVIRSTLIVRTNRRGEWEDTEADEHDMVVQAPNGQIFAVGPMVFEQIYTPA